MKSPSRGHLTTARFERRRSARTCSGRIAAVLHTWLVIAPVLSACAVGGAPGGPSAKQATQQAPKATTPCQPKAGDSSAATRCTTDQDASGDLSTVEAYTPGYNTWATLAPLPTARRAAAAVAGNDRRLYINRGLGHLLRVRFNVRPEITVFRLTTGTEEPAAT